MDAEAVLFNLGHAGVLAGSLYALPAVSVVASVLLLMVLASMAWIVRRPRRRTWPLYAYYLVLLVLVVSIPIGLGILSTRT